MSLTINTENLCKSFDYIEYVIKDMNITINSSDVTAITGKNGSGKSTLLKIIAGLSDPTSGKVEYMSNGEKVNISNISFVAPYYNLYEDYTPMELHKLVCKMHGNNSDEENFEEYLDKFDLLKKKNVAIKNFSSGMKQRLKIIMNLMGERQAYFFDEPSSNLDVFGIETLKKEIEFLKNSGNLVVIATNESNEISWCNKTINL